MRNNAPFFRGKILAALFAFCMLSPGVSCAQRFRAARLKISPDCAMDENAWASISAYVSRHTTLAPAPSLPEVEIFDDSLFDFGLLFLSCRRYPRTLRYGEILRVRKYLMNGGMIFLNAAAPLSSGFRDWSENFASAALPASPSLAPVTTGHAVLRSFFLLGESGGRFVTAPLLEAADYGEISPILYAGNDLVSIWLLDFAGNYLYECLPGGERQREMGRRLLLNIIIYSVTGTYKLDAVHQPFIMEKMRKKDAGD